MKAVSRILFLFSLFASLLTSAALADFGPQPHIRIQLIHPPEGLYYLDILEETKEGAVLGENISAETHASLRSDLLAALTRNLPQGWHACLTQGTVYPLRGDLTGKPFPEETLHSFGGSGTPSVYRIRIVTAAGESWTSPALRRAVLQSSVTVDWVEKSTSAPPIWSAFVLQFFSTFLPTLLIEGTLLFLFGYRRRKSWNVFLLVNFSTQLLLYLTLGLFSLLSGIPLIYLVFFLLIESLILIIEMAAYHHSLVEQSPGRASAYALTANVSSSVVGWYLTIPIANWLRAFS